MHKDALDAYIEVLDVYPREVTLLLRVQWMNLGYCGKPWQIYDAPIMINISKSKLGDWISLKGRCKKRTSPGLPPIRQKRKKNDTTKKK